MGLFCFSVRVFREPTVCPGDVNNIVPGGSGSEFEVESVTYCDEVPSAAQSPSTPVAEFVAYPASDGGNHWHQRRRDWS